jgi:hypothetical protein
MVEVLVRMRPDWVSTFAAKMMYDISESLKPRGDADWMNAVDFVASAINRYKPPPGKRT